MRTLTTINWMREQIRDAQGDLKATHHTGTRAGWSFRIITPKGGVPKLISQCDDGRRVTKEHRSLRAAKAAALDLLHPSERMGWNADQGTGPVQYRAQWDDLVFVVFASPEGDQFFQWRNTGTAFRSQAHPVSGIREARELASAVLRDLHPAETPAPAPQAADGALIGRLANALAAAGITFTDEQLVKAADALV